MKKRVGMMILAVLAVVAAGCFNETREHSLLREQGYVTEHTPEQVAQSFANVVYAEAGGEKLTLDVSLPAGEGPFPALVVIHGGGWKLHTNTVMEGMARYLSNRGYAVFNINYRVYPAPMPQMVEDCLGAVIWVKEHAAEYHADPNRVAVTGDSAGGHLTAMIVTAANNPEFKPTYAGTGKFDASVKCAILSYGVYDLPAFSRLPVARSILKDVLAGSYQEKPELYRKLSPITYVRAGLVPQLIVVGPLDPLYHENRAYERKLKQVGAPVEFYLARGQTHAFLNYFWKKPAQQAYDAMAAFLDRNLK
jgi:acetyl esterase/lipase